LKLEAVGDDPEALALWFPRLKERGPIEAQGVGGWSLRGE